MKKFSLLFLVSLLVYSLVSLYFLDKKYFISPIEYNGDIVVRCDSQGNGFFATSRSGNRMHQGIDLLAGMGTPVLASRSGRVISAGSNNGMGNYIVIRHNHNIVTIYGHLLQIFVYKGQFVRQGQIIGSVGKTGNARSRDILAHLHFELRKNGLPQDPLQYIE